MVRRRGIGVALAALALAGCGMKYKEPSAAGASPGLVQDGRKMIWNASLDLEVKKDRDVEPAVEKARDIAESKGGFAASESTGGIVLRVPNDRLRETIEEVERLGEVAEKRVSGDDVTAGFTDLEVRIANSKRFQETLRELAARSATVEELLQVEKEQARITAELEGLEAQMRLMQSQTTLATLHVSVSRKVRPGPVGWVFYGAFRAVKWLFIWD